MRIQAGGGGGSSPPFATSRANMLATTDTTIADGTTSGIAFDQWVPAPNSTTDYTLVPDNGDGTPGLQVNKDGLYLVEFVMAHLTLIGGTITVFLDLANSYGGIRPSSLVLTPDQLSDVNGIDRQGTYFTAISQGLDAIGVFVENDSGASITIGARSIHLFMTRIAPSPLP